MHSVVEGKKSIVPSSKDTLQDDVMRRQKYCGEAKNLLFFVPIPHTTFPILFEAKMRPPEDTNPSVIIQKFQSEDGEPLGTLRTLICEETGESYVLWKDIQEAFVGIGHLDDWSYGFDLRVLFMVDKAGELYVFVDN